MTEAPNALPRWCDSGEVRRSSSGSHRDGHRLHHDGRQGRVVGVRARGLDLLAHLEARDHLAEDGVLRIAWREEIEEVIVDRIDEELGAARVGSARIGHGKRAHLVGDLLGVLVQNVAPRIAREHLACLEVLVGGVPVRATRARVARLRVLGLWASKLEHEIRDDAVEVDAVVEARVGEVDEVAHGDGTVVEVKLRLEVAQSGLKLGDGVGHRGMMFRKGMAMGSLAGAVP
mmetsp:Transcript_13014/g.38222  ORF Transcript_13014/g.38222 Transcript_13014/m.38222 type:complete len:231 (+) Transcript_13014:326-1018(+)